MVAVLLLYAGYTDLRTEQLSVPAANRFLRNAVTAGQSRYACTVFTFSFTIEIFCSPLEHLCVIREGNQGKSYIPHDPVNRGTGLPCRSASMAGPNINGSALEGSAAARTII
jgi:hypothetical protein